MNDCIFSLTRILTRLHELHQIPITYQSHYRASNSKLFKINNCHSVAKKRKLSIGLIRLCTKTIKYAESAKAVVGSYHTVNTNEYYWLKSEIERIIPLAGQIVNVAHRRIVKGENDSINF